MIFILFVKKYIFLIIKKKEENVQSKDNAYVKKIILVKIALKKDV